MTLKDVKRAFANSTIQFQLGELAQHLEWATTKRDKLLQLAQSEDNGSTAAEPATSYATGTLRSLQDAFGASRYDDQLKDLEAQIAWATETTVALKTKLETGKTGRPSRKERITAKVDALRAEGKDAEADEVLAKEEARRANSKERRDARKAAKRAEVEAAKAAAEAAAAEAAKSKGKKTVVKKADKR